MFDFDHILKADFVPVSEADWETLRAATQTLFKPKTPVDDEKLFNGRLKQINDILGRVDKLDSQIS